MTNKKKKIKRIKTNQNNSITWISKLNNIKDNL